jgi:hypothetical protein
LSSKLHAAYEQELAEFKEKIEALTAYDNKLWTNLRTFWDKVQNQSRERNLFRDHADSLRDNINVLFDELKKIRSRVSNEISAASQTVAEEFNKALDDIEARIAAGGHKLGTVFEDLKQMQRRYRDARLTNEHRNQIWDRLDGAFKKAKERKFGPAANEGSLVERHERRLGGLLDALKRMEDSVRRDEEELNFQRKKVNLSEGQLESQIRLAKIKMIEERLVSKREKLAEMNRTRSDVERQANTAKDKEHRRSEKETERKKIEAAKETAKSEIAAQIKTKQSPTEQAGEFFEAASTVLGDLLFDALDTAKAVASVAADKADEMLEKAAAKADEVVGNLTKKTEPKSEKESIIIDDTVHKSAPGEMESFTQTEGEPTIGDKAKIIIDDVVHKAEEVLESVVAKIEEVAETLTKEEAPKPDKKDGIIIDDTVHNAGEELESTQGIIIDDTVHKSAEGLESVTEPAPKPDKKEGIIIDDVVHNANEGFESAVAETSEKAKPAKPKRMKKEDA